MDDGHRMMAIGNKTGLQLPVILWKIEEKIIMIICTPLVDLQTSYQIESL